MKKGRKLLACLVLIVMVLSQVPSNLLVRAEEGTETKYKLSFELERDASALNEIYQKHDEAEDQSEKADEKADDKVTTGEADTNKDNETVVDLSQETEAEEKTEENSSEEAKPIDEGVAGDESNQANEDEAIVLPSGGGEGPQEEKAGEVKDLNITYTVHIKGESEESIEKRIIYSVEKADFVGDLKFEGIEALSNELEVKYYSKEDESSFDEKSENFDLYLETNSEKTVLELPRIGEKEDSLRVKESNFEEALEISEEKVNEAVGNPDATEVYLNGTSGDDTKDGSKEENAVKTFKKAKELAGTDKNIIVVGTTDITGDISLAGANQKVLRGENFNEYLFRVAEGAEASLRNIVIDGNSKANENIGKSLIEVKSDATLNINDGAILKNNKIKAIENTATRGGAVNAESAIINMTGGSVEENQATYGGGIYLYKTTMNFSGGVVQNNEAKRVIDSAYGGAIYSAGGGIIASGASTINFSGDAKVLNNSADEVGGGISLGTRQVEEQNKLYMTGGLIDGNIAGASGGGIFIQCRLFNSGKSVAYISSGRITNNKMSGTGKTEMAFGGGGIYVNGFPASWDYEGNHYYGENGELYLTNAIIRNNMSDWEGAGFAGCPISKTDFFVNNGVAIYGNRVLKESHTIKYKGKNITYYHRDKGETVYLLSSKFYMSHSGQAEYKLDKRMLGGAPYDWKKVIGSEIIPLPDNELEATLPENSELALNSNDKANELTQALGKVIIEGNYSATRGAGIGSNGTIKFGTEAPTTEVSVEKKWNDNDDEKQNRPETITVNLIAIYGGQEYKVDSVVLNKDNKWEHSFKDLPTINDGKPINYTVKEEVVTGYSSKITGSEADGYTITNSYYPPEEPEKEYRDISVEKAWDIRGMKPISHIEVELYRDGEATGNTLVLSEANGWSGSFKNLEKASDGGHIYKYSVKEIGEKFYTVEISGEYYEVIYKGDMDSGFTIINREEPKKPQRRDIRVSKVWDVTNEIPVDAIQVELYKDGSATGNVITLSEANGWMGHFEDLLAYDAEGVKYEYSVREVGEASRMISISGSDYDVSYAGDMDHSFIITNRENIPPKKKTEVRVNKTWQTSGETEAVQAELYMDGAATGKVITLSEDNGWSGVFTELETEDASRIRHIYTVKEIGETFGQYNIGERKFTVTYEGSMDTGFNIVNSEEIPKEKDEKSKDKDEKPKDKNTENEKHIIPKTGVEEGTLSIVLALVVLVGLFFVKKKITKSKSK